MSRSVLHSPWLYFGGAALLLVVGVASQVRIHWPSRPSGGVAELEALRGRKDLNVVFILVDTLRADRLSAYGYSRPTSPTLDALAREGVRFAHVTAQSSWTKASMASILTAAYPATNGVERWNQALPEAATLPAEIFRQAGFRTAGLYRNEWVDRAFGFAQGFEAYHVPYYSTPPESFRQNTPEPQKLAGSDADLTRSAVEFVQSFRDERFFLYLHYMDVHQYAYDAAAPVFGTSNSDLYDSAINWVDRNIGGLVQALDKSGILSRTVIVISADHGESFREHGVEGHGTTLFREVLDVPLILVLPFRWKGGLVVETPVENLDIFPTVLDLIGLPPLPNAQGRSLVPLMVAAARGGPPPAELAERPSFAELDRTWGQPKKDPSPIVSVELGRWKLIQSALDPAEVALFDHQTDPGEAQNVVASHPEALGRLRQLAQQHVAAARQASVQPEHVEVDPARLEQLRALGYVLQPH